MANDKKGTTIVIKKITAAAAGGHGGSWKVAFADFMTAMMAFFLVMWLVGQSEDVKKQVSDYFSTPSIIEYNFSNYGVELTLEKLFMDLVNEPLKAFEQFVMPVDKRPNVMDMGLKKIQVAFLAEKIGEFTRVMDITSDEIVFDIPDEVLFKKNTALPTNKFVVIMERVREIVEGLVDSDVYINSELPYSSGFTMAQAKNVAESRLDLITTKIQHSIKSGTVDAFGKITVEQLGTSTRDPRGYIKFRIRNKAAPVTKRKNQPGLNEDQVGTRKNVQSGSSDAADSRTTASTEAEVVESEKQAQFDDGKNDVYDQFVNQMSRKVEKKKK
jgi:chemotaxis protein MotB